MPTSEVFAHSYGIAGTPGSPMTINFIFSGTAPYTLSDGADGDNDGTTAVGQTVNFSDVNAPGTATLLGFTAGGDPIIQFPSSNMYILSNDPNLLPSSPISTTTTGPYVYCFAEGTKIAAEDAEIDVGDLRIGQVLRTAEGGLAEVKWIGRQTVSTRFGPAERLMPVRFSAGSLGDGLPTTDLTVTADHGMLVDGVICHAGALVNGTTITQVPLAELGESYTVYHIETEAHEIILANGAPAETFIDNVSRRAFDNFAEFEALYGDVPEMQELPYPRAMSPRQVPGWLRRSLSVSLTA